jgi:hypothetical protein
MDNTLMLLILLAVLLVVNLIISGVVLSKLNKNKDGWAKSSPDKQPQSNAQEDSSMMTM